MDCLMSMDWLLRRFEANVEALDTLLTNYNKRLQECVHREIFQSNWKPKIPEKRAETPETEVSGKKKSTPKPLPKPPNIRTSEAKVAERDKTKVIPPNLREEDEISKNVSHLPSTKQTNTENSMITGYRELIQRSYTRLVNYISSTDDISAKLFQSNHLTQSELERIQKTKSTAKANERLLNVLVQKPVGAYRAFLDELQRTKQGHVLSILLSTDDGILERQHHAKLIRQHYVFLTETLEVVESGLVGHLVAENVLTDREKTTVATEGNRYRQAEILLGIIGRKSTGDFEKFLRALRRTNQEHVADVLQGISENSCQLKTERISSETNAKTTPDWNGHSAAKRKFHRFESQYSNLPFPLRVEISAKILALQSNNNNNNRTTEENTITKHVNTVLEGFVETRKSCFALENERNEISDLNATVKTEKQKCEDHLRNLQREFSALETKSNDRKSEILRLKRLYGDAQMEKERFQARFHESQFLNERLTIQLQETEIQLSEKVSTNEEFKRMKQDRERLETQLKAAKAELEKQMRDNLAESESVKSRTNGRLKQVETESEIRLETLRLETESRLSELSRQTEADKITITSLHNEIARLSKYVGELEHEKRRILNELKAEKEKNQRISSVYANESDVTGYEARHVDRVDIPGTWVEGAAAIGDKLYLICRGHGSLTVYSNQKPHSRQYLMSVAGMMGPLDIVACPVNRCLYIIDSGARCVWRVLGDGRCNRWLPEATWPYTLAPTADGRVLVIRRPSNLDIYDAEARLTHSVHLPQSVLDPWHAVETPSGTYLIVHGDKISQRHGVTEISRSGEVVRSCADLPGREPGRFDRPRYLALDAEGNILVADYGNSRIVLLDSSLNLIKILLKKDENGMKNPMRICYGNAKNILVVNNGILDVYAFTRSSPRSANGL